jgi:hypothetical protein
MGLLRVMRLVRPRTILQNQMPKLKKCDGIDAAAEQISQYGGDVKSSYLFTNLKII